MGGGIGGLATAVALQRRGIDAHVYESAPALGDVGKGIWMPPNAMQVLDRLGLARDVARAGVSLQRLQVQTLEGRLLQSVDLSEAEARYRQTTVSVLRSALQRVLVGALLPGTLHLGRRCTGVETQGHRPVATFGDERVEADLVVGADGLRSVVREAVVPNARLRSAGQVCALGIARAALPSNLSGTAREIWGGPSRFGFSPVTPGLVYWFAPVLAHDAEGSRLLVGGSTDALRKRYASFPSPVPELLAATAGGDVIEVELGGLVPLRMWHRGRVVLVGDAAHAMTPNLGQGGAQSLEDAFALARGLAEAPDLPTALQRYERTRRPRATRIARTAWWLGKAAHVRSPWARLLRDAALRSTPNRAQERQLDALYTLEA